MIIASPFEMQFITFCLNYFFCLKFCLIYFLQLFSVRHLNSFSPIKITNKICPRYSILIFVITKPCSYQFKTQAFEKTFFYFDIVTCWLTLNSLLLKPTSQYVLNVTLPDFIFIVIWHALLHLLTLSTFLLIYIICDGEVMYLQIFSLSF